MFTTISVVLTTLLTISSACSPKCYRKDGMIVGYDMDCYKCAHYSTDYSDGIIIDNGTFSVYVGKGAMPEIELYTSDLVIMPPNDECCPPSSYVEAITCEEIDPEPECYRMDGIVYAKYLDGFSCAHHSRNYSKAYLSLFLFYWTAAIA